MDFSLPRPLHHCIEEQQLGAAGGVMDRTSQTNSRTGGQQSVVDAETTLGASGGTSQILVKEIHHHHYFHHCCDSEQPSGKLRPRRNCHLNTVPHRQNIEEAGGLPSYEEAVSVNDANQHYREHHSIPVDNRERQQLLVTPGIRLPTSGRLTNSSRICDSLEGEQRIEYSVSSSEQPNPEDILTETFSIFEDASPNEERSSTPSSLPGLVSIESSVENLSLGNHHLGDSLTSSRDSLKRAFLIALLSIGENHSFESHAWERIVGMTIASGTDERHFKQAWEFAFQVDNAIIHFEQIIRRPLEEMTAGIQELEDR